MEGMLYFIKKSLFFLIPRRCSYRIVDIQDEKFLIRCLTSNTLFSTNLAELAENTLLLCGLGSIQASQIGIKYGASLKKNSVKCQQPSTNKTTVITKKEKLSIRYRTRDGRIGFTDNKKEYCMSAGSIINSHTLIKKFSARESFFIGTCVGLIEK